MLRLKNHVVVPLKGEGAALAFGQKTFLLPPAISKPFFRHRARLVRGISAEGELPARLLSFLNENNLLMSSGPAPAYYPAAEAAAIVEGALEMWRPLLTLHPLYAELGRRRPGLQASYLLESTVFVSKAASYFGLAAKTSGPRLRKVFRELVAEEKDHYLMLSRDLGISSEDLAAHDPLPGTEAMTSHLHFLAATDPSSLLVVTGLFETDPQALPAVRAFYKKLARDTGLVLGGFIDHHAEDAGHGHAALWKLSLAGRKRIPREEVAAWIRSLHTVKHLYGLWNDSILRDSPRRPLSKPLSMREALRPAPVPESIRV